MLGWLKAQFNRLRFLTSSVRVFGASGYSSGAPKPFNYNSAVNAFESWVFAAAMANAKGAASVPLKLYVKRKPGMYHLWNTRPIGRKMRAYLAGEGQVRPSRSVASKAADWGDDYEEVTEEHPALELLRRVNPWQCGFEMAMLRFLYLELTGNAYMHVVRDRIRGVPNELWLMPSQWVDIIPGERGTQDFIKGYTYGLGYSEKAFFTPDEVGHFKYPNPQNIYYGMGKVEAGWNVVQTNAMTHAHDLAMYANGARPDYAVIVKSGVQSSSLDRFEAKIRQHLRDARDAGRFLTVTGDVQLLPLTWPPKDLGDRQQIIEEISVVFGVPRDKLLGNATYANAERADSGWLRDTIHPMCILDEEKLNEWYLPQWGIDGDAMLAYDNPVPDDRDYQLRYYQAALAGKAWMSVNEVRQSEGEDPIDGGDEVISQQPSAFGLPGTNPMGGLFQWGRQPSHAKRYSQRDMIRNGHLHKAEAEDNVRQDDTEGRVRKYQRALWDVLIRQSAAVISAIRQEQKDRTTDVQTIMNDVVTALFEFESELSDATHDLLVETLSVGASSGFTRISFTPDFEVINPKVLAFADKYVPRLVRTLQGDRAVQIESLVRSGLERGLSPNALALEIEQSPSFVSDGIANRAEMISRTESARAYVNGQELAWRESGIVTGKKWLLAPDACEFCNAMGERFGDAQVELGQAFLTKGGTLTGTEGGQMALDYSDIDGPPLHPHCRCDLVPVV